MFYKFNETHKYQPNRHYIRYWTRTLHANATMRKKWPINCFGILFLFILSLSFHLEMKCEAAEKNPINTCVHTLKKLSITNWLLDWQEWLRKHIKTDFKGHVLSYCVRALSVFLFLIQPQLFYSPGLTYIIWNLTTIHLGTHYSNFSHDRFNVLLHFRFGAF